MAEKKYDQEAFKARFGFEPKKGAAMPMECVLVSSKIRLLAELHRITNDKIVELREKYEGDLGGARHIVHDEVLKDRDEAVRLEQEREDVYREWAEAWGLAQEAGYEKLTEDRHDIGSWY